MSDAATALTSTQSLTTVDGRPLKEALAAAERSKRIKAILLVTPLFIFLFFTFLYPIGLMLFRSVENPLIANHMPLTVAACWASAPFSHLLAPPADPAAHTPAGLQPA